MSTTLTPPVEFETLADLLDRLGADIPPERIRMTPPPGTATDADLIRLNESPLRTTIYELVDGTLVEKAMGFLEGVLGLTIGQIIGNWLDEHREGIASGSDGMMKLTGRTTRIPDISFVSWDQLPDRTIPTAPNPELFPDLAIEVLSLGNRPGEMRRKRDDYFAAGARLVWEIDPRKRTITAYTSPEDGILHAEDEPVSAGDVLPGFEITLAEIFARAERR